MTDKRSPLRHNKHYDNDDAHIEFPPPQGGWAPPNEADWEDPKPRSIMFDPGYMVLGGIFAIAAAAVVVGFWL